MKFDLQNFLQGLLNKTGRWYIVVAVAGVQLIAFISAGLATFFTQSNAQLSPEQLGKSSNLLFYLVLIGDAAMLAWAFMANREAGELLEARARNVQSPPNSQREIEAWKQINSLPSRFAVATVFVAFVFEVFPMLYYLYRILHITFDQAIYTLEGSIVVTLGAGVISTFLLDQFMRPARKILLPKSFEAQHVGVIGFPLWARILGIALVLIAVTGFLVAPIGYHHAILAAQSGENIDQVLYNFRIQAGLASLVAVLFGLIFAWLLVRSVMEPIERIVKRMREVEQGQLGARISVTAPDEIGEMAIYFNHMTESLGALQATFESQVKERTARLNATIGVSQAVSAILDVNELTERVVNVIAQQFNYYYVALFLISPDGKWAELRAATGDAGRVLLQNKHRLEVGSKSMVGTSILVRQPRVAMATSEEPIRFDNPLLPYTRSEIALPLMAGDRVLGALDAQSTKEGAFGPEDIETLQSTANLVAIALENARLFQESAESLREMRAIQQQYLVTSWQNISNKSELGYTIGELDANDQSTEVEIPLTLREQKIGVINLTSETDLEPEDKYLLEAVATQTALALENARLVEESQTTARREHLVSEITGKIWSSNTVDGILQAAIKELGRALDTDEVTIELKVD